MGKTSTPNSAAILAVAFSMATNASPLRGWRKLMSMSVVLALFVVLAGMVFSPRSFFGGLGGPSLLEIVLRWYNLVKSLFSLSATEVETVYRHFVPLLWRAARGRTYTLRTSPRPTGWRARRVPC